MGAGAIIMGGLAVGQSIFGATQQSKARRRAEKLKKERKPVTNPFTGLTPSTLGANIQGQQALRGLATQTNAFANAGGRAMSFISPAARQLGLVDQNIAANLDLQQKQIDFKKAQGEQYVQQVEEQRFQQEMGGYAQQFAVGQQNMFSGFNMLGNIAASGFAQGGAFNRPSSTGTTGIGF